MIWELIYIIKNEKGEIVAAFKNKVLLFSYLIKHYEKPLGSDGNSIKLIAEDGLEKQFTVEAVRFFYEANKATVGGYINSVGYEEC